jgi:hypothetical protein
VIADCRTSIADWRIGGLTDCGIEGLEIGLLAIVIGNLQSVIPQSAIRQSAIDDPQSAM